MFQQGEALFDMIGECKMEKFQRIALGGYKKKEIDKYIEMLMSAMEQMAANYNYKSERLENEIQILETQLETEKKEKQELSNQLLKVGRANKNRDSGLECEIRSLQEQLGQYQCGYDIYSGVIFAAKEEAEQIVNTAKAEAERILKDAHKQAAAIKKEMIEEADRYKEEVKQDMKRMEKENEKKYMLAKYNMMEYLTSLNQSQRQLIETYNEIGRIAKEVPVNFEDIILDESFEELFERK